MGPIASNKSFFILLGLFVAVCLIFAVTSVPNPVKQDTSRISTVTGVTGATSSEEAVPVEDTTVVEDSAKVSGPNDDLIFGMASSFVTDYDSKATVYDDDWGYTNDGNTYTVSFRINGETEEGSGEMADYDTEVVMDYDPGNDSWTLQTISCNDKLWIDKREYINEETTE